MLAKRGGKARGEQASFDRISSAAGKSLGPEPHPVD
jgi:hypothetical protein